MPSLPHPFSENTEGCDFMKKLSSILSKLNIFTSLVFYLFFALLKTDIYILGEPMVALFTWSIPIVCAVTLLFVISTAVIAIKDKKLPDSFGYVISYLFTAISLCISIWFVYSFLDAWFDF